MQSYQPTDKLSVISESIIEYYFVWIKLQYAELMIIAPFIVVLFIYV